MDTWIHRMVQTGSRRQIVAWAVAGGVAAALLLFELQYIPNFLFGPYPVDAVELAAIHDVSEAAHYFVRVTGSDVHETGVEQVTELRKRGIRVSRYTSEVYYAVLVGDRYLICEAPPYTTGKTFEGELENLSSELETKLFAKASTQGLRNRFYPFYLANTSFRLPGYVASAGLVLLSVLFWLYGVPAWRTLKRPALHPAIRRASTEGDPSHLWLAAERESKTPRFKLGAWSVTDNFLIRSGYFAFDVRPLSTLVWAYKGVTQHTYNNVKSHKTYELRLFFGPALSKLSLHGNESVVDAILEHLRSRVPSAVFGYSLDLDRELRRNPSALGNIVADRRRDHAGGTESSSAPRTQVGLNSHARLCLSLADAMVGGMHDVLVSTLAWCETCGGRTVAERGVFTLCAACKGRPLVEREHKIKIKVPPGIGSGQRLRVPGLGSRALGGAAPGDLYVDVEVAPDPHFERHADDLLTRVSISARDAALGSKVQVELPDASVVSVPIPSGTQPGMRLAVTGQGMPRVNRGGRGDLHVQVQIAEGA
jgi:DnaJ-like protein/uncharacterized protein DUF6709